ncbi:hypothetical protein E8L99_21015 [Phreatobacter aquaticus]|uniref:DUF4019 domain-containing protein n=1 Tax=Phreatobacter aquaticus TaxID=2570229 RepID=A0A4D7QRE4_9HYPH|nr:hypothetical protein [Phreatobacter aquaticus]QCK88059.1 hypothetical protein E8L99_21015 [Phreatobacter aquaticus]
MSSRSRMLPSRRGLVSGALVLPALMLGQTRSLAAGAPSDAEMIDNLTKNREAFDELVAMVRADRRLERVDDTWTRPTNPATIGVTPERITLYRTKMAALGIARGFSAFRPDGAIFFLVYAEGTTVNGRGKSYVWSETGDFSESSMEADLDPLWATRRRRVYAFRKVDGPWFLHMNSY